MDRETLGKHSHAQLSLICVRLHITRYAEDRVVKRKQRMIEDILEMNTSELLSSRASRREELKWEVGNSVYNLDTLAHTPYDQLRDIAIGLGLPMYYKHGVSKASFINRILAHQADQEGF